MKKDITIGTRASKLALWQANHVKALLEEQFQANVTLKKISTKGDRILDRSLMDIGGKGLFLKEIEDALLVGEVDIAVHSMKDVPYELPEGLVITAILPRENPHDAFVSSRFKAFEDLPNDAVIGTTSLRRVEQLKQMNPNLKFKDLRGNVDTRLAKLQAGEYDAIVLACAGLKRLGLQEHICQELRIVPAVGQGAVGIECREMDDELVKMVSALNDAKTKDCVDLERYFLAQIEGDCKTPVGCHVKQSADNPDLYQVSCFYQQEHVFKESSESKKSDVKSLLDTWIQRIKKN
jgi:hydroxymethylbilane synthase